MAGPNPQDLKLIIEALKQQIETTKGGSVGTLAERLKNYSSAFKSTAPSATSGLRNVGNFFFNNAVPMPQWLENTAGSIKSSLGSIGAAATVPTLSSWLGTTGGAIGAAAPVIGAGALAADVGALSFIGTQELEKRTNLFGLGEYFDKYRAYQKKGGKMNYNTWRVSGRPSEDVKLTDIGKPEQYGIDIKTFMKLSPEDKQVLLFKALKAKKEEETLVNNIKTELGIAVDSKSKAVLPAGTVIRVDDKSMPGYYIEITDDGKGNEVRGEPLPNPSYQDPYSIAQTAKINAELARERIQPMTLEQAQQKAATLGSGFKVGFDNSTGGYTVEEDRNAKPSWFGQGNPFVDDPNTKIDERASAYQDANGQWQNPYFVSPYEQFSMEMSRQEAAQKQQQYLANLRANPASWIEYSLASGQQPQVQPWMQGLIGGGVNAPVGSPIPGFTPNPPGLPANQGAPVTPTGQMSPSVAKVSTNPIIQEYLRTGVIKPTDQFGQDGNSAEAITNDWLQRTGQMPGQNLAAYNGNVAGLEGYLNMVDPTVAAQIRTREGIAQPPVSALPPTPTNPEPQEPMPVQPSPEQVMPNPWLEELDKLGTYSFASGGIAWGPTKAIIGDRPDGQPEAVVPASWLNTMTPQATVQETEDPLKLINPSLQYLRRMNPSQIGQYQSYQKAQRALSPEDLSWLWASTAPPSGENRGLRYGR